MAATVTTSKLEPAKSIPRSVKFILGGSAGMAATLFVQPLDLIKNRMQLSGEGGVAKEHKTSFHAFRSIVKNEGLFGLYTGLSAGLFRQASYTTVRMGVYTSLFEWASESSSPSFFMKAGIGMCAGAVGAFFGTPAEVALIRMTSDGRLPPEERRGYRNVFDALFRIAKEENVLTLWRGCMPTIGRAMVVNAAQLASYSQTKQFLLGTGHFKDNIGCHFAASMISGLVTTTASMPVDIAKTRIQNMKVIDGKPQYTGALDVLSKVVRSEGLFALWKGFTPYYARLGPHTVLTFIFLEQMNKAYYRHVLGAEQTKASI
ncbi:mitochondrial 2-oxoglutarate/malate carrier protein-like [Varroa destructor]|uniref:Mitochondrial 2-oxoglutarate/malate carrier protein n=1 Tax=Varroa destructor TaxID=109461 RepID=A0A7M7MI85_VARDE|nr:mitochondrial 2-oxoglutarate/malate carrier protein-like [Varroa destructor]XP_022665972.1 mitochondrial 2-oxoglutarate/malate carrier protein-like [Varroa destructor]XP_022665973.1 mitochondrial 2-oxoglutarate/malate carrier protein-like [Varroa destructor]XP_022665974.1 mitochondrial 2-oxoglutarate/malate carrier protein-like [Varroa destructor]XP_022665975.1 mitochondrial 2-oxoglutarate/malate carrier protein-like [Varroa destructor]XP_022665976.1 mitochondrial 2-oxoglutarate/malate carr